MRTGAISMEPKAASIRDEWERLADSEREGLLPVLLNRMTGWHAWSTTDTTRLAWLERQFERAGVPFRPTE